MLGLVAELTRPWETAFHYTYFEDEGCSVQALLLFFFLTLIDVLTAALPDFWFIWIIFWCYKKQINDVCVIFLEYALWLLIYD